MDNKAKEIIEKSLKNTYTRMNSLYYQVDEYAKQYQFRFNQVQLEIYRRMWYKMVILKGRQMGLTTFIQLYMLDKCLFNDNVSAGVIAHNKDDAENFFTNKIKFAYDNLPDYIKQKIPAEQDRANKLSFKNGSSIRVGTSLRSDTLQYLSLIHISEPTRPY